MPIGFTWYATYMRQSQAELALYRFNTGEPCPSCGYNKGGEQSWHKYSLEHDTMLAICKRCRYQWKKIPLVRKV